MLAKDGSWVWVLDRGRVIQRDADGRPVRAAGMHFDITARKLAEAELHQYRQHLEDLVAVRTAELHVAKDAAEEAELAG